MKKIAIALLMTFIGNLFSKENIQDVLNFIYKYLEEKVITTDSPVDDEALDVIKKLLNEQELVNLIDGLIQSKLKQ